MAIQNTVQWTHHVRQPSHVPYTSDMLATIEAMLLHLPDALERAGVTPSSTNPLSVWKLPVPSIHEDLDDHTYVVVAHQAGRHSSVRVISARDQHAMMILNTLGQVTHAFSAWDLVRSLVAERTDGQLIQLSKIWRPEGDDVLVVLDNGQHMMLSTLLAETVNAAIAEVDDRLAE